MTALSHDRPDLAVDTSSPGIVTDAGALATMLAAALREGLPMPREFTAEGYLGPTLVFASLADLTEWASWREAVIKETTEVLYDRVKHAARVEWLDWPVNLLAWTARGAA